MFVVIQVVVLLYIRQKNESYFKLFSNLFLSEKVNVSCTFEFINNNKLPQDHPCIIKLIRKHFLIEPPAAEVPLALQYPNIADPSVNGKAWKFNRLLQNKTAGFFIESGAFDGEIASNSLYMERFRGWTGILIEPSPDDFEQLLSKNRKVWAVPCCLSPSSYPLMSKFNANPGVGFIIDGLNTSLIKKVIDIQCFPLYSIMLAVQQTTIDFLSLDIQGHEMKVLQTIPWDKVNIKVLMVEYVHIPEGKETLVSYMESKGYISKDYDPPEPWDIIFVKSN